MEGILVLLAKAALGLGLSYWVYRDCSKKNIKHCNLWVIGTFLFPPIALFYYIYQATIGKNKELSLEQKFEVELRHQTARRKLDVEKERKLMELIRKEEQEKNQITLEEIEKIKAERIALKAKRLAELKEERRQQQEEIAKKMKMSIDAANNMKMFD
ncbi:hypothetical protein EOL96_05090 [Candidatus Saccharibacteria bacterium]|nr:hypothetical protein [Candidatus Saccharibacteria bacterium]